MRLLCTFLFASFLFASCSSSDSSDDTPIDDVTNPALKVTVTATVIDNGNEITGIDDIIEYNISIHNTGDVTLSSVSLVSSLRDFLNNTLNLDASPTFINSSSGSEMGSILADEVATYRTSFTITQNEVDADGLSYSVTVNAMTAQNESVSDVSDNGDDSDGNLDNDTTETSIEFDPLVIAEYHILNSSGDIVYKFKFDSVGRLSQVVNVNDNNTFYEFNYDSENKIISIIETDSNNMPIEVLDITYTSENKIQSVGDRTFLYNPDLTSYVPVDGYSFPSNGNNFYIDETSYYSTGLDVGFRYYIEDMTGQVFDVCYQYQIILDSGNVTYESCLADSNWNYSNNLLVSYDSDEYPNYHDYDMQTNPLYQGSTNFKNLAPFFNLNSFFFGDASLNSEQLLNKNLFSINNRTRLYFDTTGTTPESYTFIYEFNALGLPTQSTIEVYYFVTIENEFLYNTYYYQGDDIPD